MFRRFEFNQVYQPTREWDATPETLGRAFQDLTLTAADDARISAWFFPADAASPRRQTTLLICHGNGGNISHRLPTCRTFLQTGASVMVFDYRGYGRSEGQLSEEGTYLDAQAAHAWLRQQGMTAIIPFGKSLGGAVAAELALREKSAGLVLVGAFTSVADVGAEYFPWLPVRHFNRIKYDNLHKLPRIKIPVLIMHSREDEVIRFRHGERNFAAANDPKTFLELHGGHNEAIAVDSALCVEAVKKFLSTLEIESAASK